MNTHLWRFALALFFMLVNAQYLFATASYKVTLATTPPKIDGRLDDKIWETATPITEFVQRQPNIGEPGTEPTFVYLLYDANFLYIAMRCIDDPKKITANELARDVSLGNDDRVQIIFDTFLDKRNGYWFQIGPKGSIGDALVSENGAGFNKQWDGLWEGKAKIHDTGWDAEIAIPFKTLNFRPDQPEWGMKIIRNIKRKSETSYWPVANLDSYRFQISDAGLITGLHGITKGIGLDISPYLITGIDNPESVNSNYIRNHNPMFNLGGDLFYRVTPGIKAALTINTDFAQTEVDSRQINLTRFNLLFPEKRNFFLDGAQYFNFGISGTSEEDNTYGNRNIPFFSRQIGLDSAGNPIPILWGGKVTGQAGRYNIGFQHIQDQPDDGRSFTVARISRNMGSQSYIGAIGTLGNALSVSDNLLLGLDTRLATAKFKGNKIMAFTGYVMKSHTEGLQGKDLSWGAEINYPNDFFKFRLGHQEIGKNYRAGIGFVPRLGIKENYAEMSLGPRPDKWGILQINVKAEGDFITSYDNSLLTRDIQLTPFQIEMISGDGFKFNTSSQFEFLDKAFDIFERDSISIPAGKYDFWKHKLQFSSARRRRVWVQPEYSWGSFYNGQRQEFEFAFGYKINTPIFIGMEYQHNWISLPAGDFDTEVYRVNANIFFSPDISLTNFIQYDNVSEKMGWQTRFRWIIKPGNEILFVWNSTMYELPEETRFAVQQSSTRLKVNYNIRI